MGRESLNAVDTLCLYVISRRPIIYIIDNDFKHVDSVLNEVKEKTNVKQNIYEYNEAQGTVDFDTKLNKGFSGDTLIDFFKMVDLMKDPTFVVLKDIHLQLGLPEVFSRLKAIALKKERNENFDKTVFIVSSKLNIPKELEEYVTVYSIPYPELDEIKAMIKDFAESNKIEIEEKTISEHALSLKGLRRYEVKQTLRLVFAESLGSLQDDIKDMIIREKEQKIKKTGLLEFIRVDESIDDIGGLECLKDYLRKKAEIFERLAEANEKGVDTPKGIMIVGMPGCGKSLTARVTSRLFKVPLLRLDVGKLMGKYVGESEENLRSAIQTAEAVSPCILWIDEIEKAFAGIGATGGGSDVTTRLFGNFLTWLQENETSVYVVATSNDITKLPPEFLRRGRFDELFFVGLPNTSERSDIFRIHIKKRKKKINQIDMGMLASKTKGFCGADIESVVKGAIAESFLKNHVDQLETQEFLEEIKSTKSIKKTLGKKLDEMEKNLGNYDFKMASKGQDS